jgi:N-methylhydantoinase A/oxoprolinase/acetone carboxylase beta subunit
MTARTVRIAVDIGGTFVDAVAFDAAARRLHVEKSPTTPGDPVRGVMDAVAKLGVELSRVDSFLHGTTLGINAYLERKGARTGILTNEGFRDVYEIGRTNLPRRAMYDMLYNKPPPLVPRRRRLGVPGRIGPGGEVLEPLDEGAVAVAADHLVEKEGVESIAICFLHSYRNPEPEHRAAEIVAGRHPGVSISVSSAISREYREYERTSTAVVDAYIKPIFSSYVDRLQEALAAEGFRGSFLLARSGGGTLTAPSAKRAPVHTILSGPAGGLIGATHVARETGHPNLIAVDLGGTSLDACVVEDGSAAVEYEANLEHLPVMIPVYDIRSIGAGGGSIAWLDGSLLKVGPRSAGAEPGPMCYGRGGEEPTVTDAALVLGYLDPGAFLGGEMRLEAAAAHRGLERIARPLGMSTLQAARGVYDVTVAKIVGAIREITVEKGLDPRDFSVLAFGGAGPMAIPLLGREMQIGPVVVPQAPSAFSAWGMLNADVVHDFSRTEVVLLSELDFDRLEGVYAPLEETARATLEEEGFGEKELRLERSAAMRYHGQEHTVEVRADDLTSVEELASRFEECHRSRYGHAMGDPAQLVHLRVRAVGRLEKPALERVAKAGEAGARVGTQQAYCFARGAVVEFGVHARDRLGRGDEVVGPAIIREPTTTVVLQSDQRATVDEFGQLAITTERRNE